MQMHRYKEHGICPVARQDASGAWTLTVVVEGCQGLYTVIRSCGREQPFLTEAAVPRCGVAYGTQRIDAGTVGADPPAPPAPAPQSTAA
jgi:hypothetical protein